MKKTIAIFGLGKFGKTLIEEFLQYDYDIIGVDIEEEKVKEASSLINDVYVGNSTNPEVLEEIGVKGVDVAIIGFGSRFEDTILTFMNLKNIGVKNIIVKCNYDKYLPVYEKIGITQIISPSVISGERLADKIARPEFDNYFRLAGKYCVVDFVVNEKFSPTKLIDIHMRKDFNLNLILIGRNGSTLLPEAETIINPKDKLYVFGTKTNISKFISYINKD